MELVIACDFYKTLFMSVCELRARDEFVLICIVSIIYLLQIYDTKVSNIDANRRKLFKNVLNS